MRYQINFGTLPASVARPQRIAGQKFRLAVLGDFSARAHRGLLERGDALSARSTGPRKIDVDNLDNFIARLGIHLNFSVGGGNVDLAITSLDDLHPDHLYQQLPIFAELASLRRCLANDATFAKAAEKVRAFADPEGKILPHVAPPAAPAEALPTEGTLDDFADLLGRAPAPPAATTPLDTWLKGVVAPHIRAEIGPDQAALMGVVDDALSSTMREVLHHPDLQTVEAALHALDLLVRNLETDDDLEVVVYDISAAELAADLSATSELEKTALYQLLVEAPQLSANQGPLSTLIGLYTFEQIPAHAALLGRLASLAQAAGAPFLAALGGPLPPPELAGDTEAAWSDLKELPQVAYLGLVAPRFLVRLPYGKKLDPIDAFVFEELELKSGLSTLPWGNPAVLAGLLLGQTFTQQGDRMTPGTHLTIDDRPAFVYLDDQGEQIAASATEQPLSERHANESASAGLMPLLAIRGRTEVRLGSFQAISGDPLAGAAWR